MTTPLGGDYHTAIWFDEAGNRLDGPEGAVTGEITEKTLDGLELGRTYVDLRPDPEAIVAQESDPNNEAISAENADLLSMGTWDIWVKGWTKKVETLAELLEAFDWETLPLRQQRIEVSALMGLPMWVPAPQSLKDEVLAWLGATVQE